MDLFLLAVASERDRRPRFAPGLAPALVLADLLDKLRRGRAVPDSIAEYLRERAPSRLGTYVEDARQRGIVHVSVQRQGYFEHTRVQVADRWPVDRAVDRLLRILESGQHPEARDLVFVVLAGEIGAAQPLLKSRRHRERRRRLELFAAWVAEQEGRRSAADRALYQGIQAIRMMADERPAVAVAAHR